MEDAVAAEGLRMMLRGIGLDLDDPLLRETPRRVTQSYRELLGGVSLAERAPLATGDPVPDGLEVVALRGLEFRSMCAHHLLPFSGVAHIAYEPRDRLVGLGSVVNTLDILSRRPQLQERLSQQFAIAVQEGAGAAGVLVVMDARHGCIADRGPRQAESRMTTLGVSGSYRDPENKRRAMLALEMNPSGADVESLWRNGGGAWHPPTCGPRGIRWILRECATSSVRWRRGGGSPGEPHSTTGSESASETEKTSMSARCLAMLIGLCQVL